MRLAIYAHYGNSTQVAGYVFYYLEQVSALGFQVCFVSNSGISPADERRLKIFCGQVIVRENTGLDFCMWQRGMAEYDLLQFDELLLTNSSIIGPLQPLAPFWQNPVIADCDFWGLTDNDELSWHLQSYFLVFRKQVLHSARFADFWRSVLPYQHKQQVIFSYELGLTTWLKESGFKGRAIFLQEEIISSHFNTRSFWQKCHDYFYPRYRTWERNPTVIFPDLFLQRGMPFLKAVLLGESSSPLKPSRIFAILKKQKNGLPVEVLEELRRTFPMVNDPAEG